MGDIADRYRKLAASFTEKVAAVPDDRWSSPSPCPEWSARDVVGHVTDTQGMFLGFVELEAPTGASVEDDPLGAWTAARNAVQAGLGDPATASKDFDAFFGPTTFEAAVDRFLCFDLVVHRWDLARTTGQDERLDRDEIERCFEAGQAFGPALRSEGVCGPEIETPPGASDQAHLLAFLGRNP